MHTAIPALTLLIVTQAAHAQQLNSRAQLEAILDDQILLEDFETVSLHGGSLIEVPNPLNADTVDKAPFGMDVLPGVTYESPTILYLYAGFISGEDDIYLRALDTLTITFDQPQIAMGLDLPGTPNTTVTIYTRDGSVLDQITTTNALFFGYQAPAQGISSLTITHPTSTYIAANNVAYGADFIPCPADINNDNAQNFLDVSAFLSYFANEDDRADYTDDGQFNFLDVSFFLNAFSVACP